MATLTWLLATHNQGKIKELRKILADSPIEVIGLSDCDVEAESPESGSSFRENAMQKAEYYHDLTGHIVLADDSGLEVDALNGAPGIHSARFGGLDTHEEKCSYLLELLGDVPENLRTARFTCAAVYYDGQRFLSVQDSVEGYIGKAPVGDGGFGYDPIFHPELGGPSLAEYTMEAKNKISHRGKAFRRLIDQALTTKV